MDVAEICFRLGITIETITTESSMILIKATNTKLEMERIQEAVASEELKHDIPDVKRVSPSSSFLRGQERVTQRKR
jgi:hypothetical protein